MKHPVFGEITYVRRDQAWHGQVRLASFAAYDVSARKRAEAEYPREARREPPLPEDTDEERRFREGWFALVIELPYAARPSGFLGVLRQAVTPSRYPAAEPLPAQERAYRYLVEHEAEVMEVVARETFCLYRETSEEARRGVEGARDASEQEVLLPRLQSPAGLRDLMRLGSVTLCGTEREGVAPVRLFFDCTWDDEHGHELFVWKDQISFDLDTAQ